MMVVGLVGPHCPFVCPPDLFRKYFETVTIPEFPDGYLKGMHPYHRRTRERSRIDDLSQHEIRRTRAAYYGMVEYDDMLVGLLLEALEDEGVMDETLIIYTSDHGDMAGEHGLWWKMSFFEGSAGVPLIVSLPRDFRAGVPEPAPVSLTDIASTLAGVAGAPGIPGTGDRSLLGCVTGEEQGERRAFSELFIDPPYWGEQGPCGGPGRMLRKGRWKCIYYQGEEPELYDLVADPGEMQNLSADPEHAEVVDVMLAEILEGWDPDRLTREMTEILERIEFASGAPQDSESLRREHWTGPEGYGDVDPV
jgi:choline-sulfatase